MKLRHACFSLSLLPLFIPSALSQSSSTPGKFFIVGMGTAPDLITLRAQNSIARADILLAEEGAVAQI